MPRKGLRRETQKEKKKRLGEVAPVTSQDATNYGVAHNIDKSLAQKLDEEIGENWKLVEDAKTVRIKITINEHGEEVISVVNANEDEKHSETEIKSEDTISRGLLLDTENTHQKDQVFSKSEGEYDVTYKEVLKGFNETETENKLEDTKSSGQTIDAENVVSCIGDEEFSKPEAKYDESFEEERPGHNEKEIQQDNIPNDNETNINEKSTSNLNDSSDYSKENEDKEYSALYNEKTNTIEVLYDNGQATNGAESKCPDDNDPEKNIDSSETNFVEVLNFWGGVRKDNPEINEKVEKKKVKKVRKGKRNGNKNKDLKNDILKSDNLKNTENEESNLNEKNEESFTSEDHKVNNMEKEDDSNGNFKEVNIDVTDSTQIDNLENNEKEENASSKSENMKNDVNATIIPTAQYITENKNTDRKQNENEERDYIEQITMQDIVCDMDDKVVEEFAFSDELTNVEKIESNQLHIKDDIHMDKEGSDTEQMGDEERTEMLESMEDQDDIVNSCHTEYTQEMTEEKHVTLDEICTIEKIEESKHGAIECFKELSKSGENDNNNTFENVTLSTDKLNHINDIDNENGNSSENEHIEINPIKQTIKNEFEQEKSCDNIDQNPKSTDHFFTSNDNFSGENDLPTNMDSWVNTKMSSYQYIQLDEDMGFGILSEREEKCSVKVLLKDKSPFLYNKEGALHQLLPSMHFYSLPYSILRTSSRENSDRTVFMLKHFINIPSLSLQQMNNLQVVACQQSSLEEFVFIKPLHVDLQYIYIQPQHCNWFQVISNFDHLPISCVLVPFMTALSIDPTISICALPSGPLHIRKMLQEKPEWKKCGYEEPCVLNKGEMYQLVREEGMEEEWGGEIRTGLSIKDMQWVKYREDRWRNQAYVKLSLREHTNHNQILEKIAFSGDLSLYHYLTFEQDFNT